MKFIKILLRGFAPSIVTLPVVFVVLPMTSPPGGFPALTLPQQVSSVGSTVAFCWSLYRTNKLIENEKPTPEERVLNE